LCNEIPDGLHSSSNLDVCLLAITQYTTDDLNYVKKKKRIIFDWKSADGADKGESRDPSDGAIFTAFARSIADIHVSYYYYILQKKKIYEA